MGDWLAALTIPAFAVSGWYAVIAGSMVKQKKPMLAAFCAWLSASSALGSLTLLLVLALQ